MRDTKKEAKVAACCIAAFVIGCFVFLSGCAVGAAAHSRVFDSSLDAGAGGFIGDPYNVE